MTSIITPAFALVRARGPPRHGDAVRRGSVVYKDLNGQTHWEWLAAHPAEETDFNASMARRGATQVAEPPAQEPGLCQRKMCVCPDSSRSVPPGRAAATAACAFFRYTGLLPPAITRAGIVTPDR